MDQKPHARSHGYSTDNANPTRSNLQKPAASACSFRSSPPCPGPPATRPGRDHPARTGRSHARGRSQGRRHSRWLHLLRQFVDHDMTFDPTSLGENAVTWDDLVNFRTPALDLDSVYGSGPRDQPFLYQRNTTTASAQMLVGPAQVVPPAAPGGGDAQVKALTARCTTCRAWPTACPSARRCWATSATTKT